MKRFALFFTILFMASWSFGQNTSIDGQPCPGAATLTDVDGNVYNTVQIGQQCWMKENLKTTRYADSTSISKGSGKSSTTGYWYYPDDNFSNTATYGLLYNWKAVMRNSSSSSANPSGVQGICPTGWHVPSDEEWGHLERYVLGQSKYRLVTIAKALASTEGWESCSPPGTVGNCQSVNNITGFSAMPAGNYHGRFLSFSYFACFWSATQSSCTRACGRALGYGGTIVGHGCSKKYDGFSVRCIRD